MPFLIECCDNDLVLKGLDDIAYCPTCGAKIYFNGMSIKTEMMDKPFQRNEARKDNGLCGSD
jgi:hypothetical protein